MVITLLNYYNTTNHGGLFTYAVDLAGQIWVFAHLHASARGRQK